jgi:hypothetical protein
MIELKTWKHEDCTLGRLSCGGVHCFTLELPWLGNQQDISCIPAGWYEYVSYDSPKHGDVLLLLDVKGRSMIEIHAGNYTRQIEGCILVGDSIKYLDADQIPDVTNSKATLSKLLAVAGNSGIIKIERV